MTPLSDTFFTQPSHWGWLVILYFFFGGVAGGAYALAALAELAGGSRHRTLARLGYEVAFLALLPCPPLLILDLDRPERFWHLFVMSERGGPMFKSWSPISIGSWVLLVFGAFATVGFFRARRGLGEGRPGRAIAALGAVPALFVAGYTGVLLSVTNRPVWGDTTVLGALFVVSAASTSVGVLGLVAARTEGTEESLAWLARFEVRLALVELVAIGALLVSLGPVARVWAGGWGALLGVVVVLGVVVPLLAAARPKLLGPRTATAAAAMVVVAGLLLRATIVLASESIGPVGRIAGV